MFVGAIAPVTPLCPSPLDLMLVVCQGEPVFFVALWVAVGIAGPIPSQQGCTNGTGDLNLEDVGLKPPKRRERTRDRNSSYALISGLNFTVL